MIRQEFNTASGMPKVHSGMGFPVIATTGTNENINTYLFWIKSDFSKPAESPSNYFSFENEPSLFSVPDVILRAEKILGLSKQHLAKVFATSRQNLYNLLNNPEQKPLQDTVNRAKQVNEALNMISSICPYKLGASTLTVRIDDKRLFDVLTEATIDSNQVRHFSEVIASRINKKTHSNLPDHIVKQETFLSRPNAI
jgi:hypothetical protein